MITLKHLFIAILITAVVFSFLGYFIGNRGGGAFQAGWDAAGERLESIGYYEQGSSEAYSLGGEIVSVSGNRIGLKLSQPLELLANPDLDNRVIQVNDQTKITIRKTSPAMKEYEEKMRVLEEQAEAESFEPENWPEPPEESFIIQEISLSDLEIGQRITVKSANNIKDEKEFVALEILAREIIE